MKQRIYILFFLCFVVFFKESCRNKTKDHLQQQSTEKTAEEQPDQSSHGELQKAQYTCPMHPEIVKDGPGQCPICGMDLVKNEPDAKAVTIEKNAKSEVREITLETLLKPADEFVVSSIPVTVIKKKAEVVEISVPGKVEYDNRWTGNISSRVSGRIEKLYVRYQYQPVQKGQKVLDIYSPELLTAQQNLIFLLKNDPENGPLIQSAKERLLLLGMTAGQLQEVMQAKKPQSSVSVHSNYGGHLHSAGEGQMQGSLSASVPAGSMGEEADLSTQPVGLKEGMYVQRGQNLFSVYDPSRAWALLNIYPGTQGLVKEGQLVKIVPESNRSQAFQGKINFIEPFYREDSKTVTARIYFDNSSRRLPIGSQVQATVYVNTPTGYWLPEESVYSLGYTKVVFLKEPFGFRAKKITTGVTVNKHVQVLSGLVENDSVAVNARFLTDSESFIKIKQ